MTTLRIATLSTFADRLRENLAIPAEVVAAATEGGEEMFAAARDADVLVNGVFKAEWTAHVPRLRLIHAVGAGYDGIQLAAVPAGVRVANVYGHDYGIAEYVFMTMAALNRELFAADRDLREGRWRGGPLRELRGRTLLIVGLGHIGREVARWAHFVGMRGSAVTEHPSEERRQAAGLERLGSLADLAEYARDAQFLVVAVPHAADTENLVGEQVLAALAPTSYLINVGRGSVVDQWALYHALRDGRLAGAAVDVWYHYPDSDSPQLPADAPLHELPNIIITPHTSGYTEGTMRHRWAAIAENIRRLTTGEPLANVVWPKGQGQAEAQ